MRSPCLPVAVVPLARKRRAYHQEAVSAGRRGRACGEQFSRTTYWSAWRRFPVSRIGLGGNSIKLREPSAKGRDIRRVRVVSGSMEHVASTGDGTAGTRPECRAAPKVCPLLRALAAVPETTTSSEPPHRLRRINFLCTYVSTNFLIHRGVAK